MARTGYVIVNMHFRVPVNVEFYKSAYNKEIHEITSKDITDVEIDNFQSNPEEYQEMLSEHLESLTFDFDEVHDHD
jgi:hypothetical protein